MTEFKQGDYVLTSKFEDGDPADQWAVGFFDSMLNERYIVVDGDGTKFRCSGFRRCEKIPTEVGEWLLLHAVEFSDRNSDFNYDEDGNKCGRSIWDIAASVLLVAK